MLDGAPQKKQPRYVVVADALKKCDFYVKVDDLAKQTLMTKKQFTSSVTLARRHLAKEGIIIVNKVSHGYRVGSIEEFQTEVNKSCLRAAHHLSSMAKLIAYLKFSLKNEADFSTAWNLIRENLRSIEMLFDQPEYDDYDDADEYRSARDEYHEENRVMPEFISEIPHEVVTNRQDLK
jgi:hypothetical protein